MRRAKLYLAIVAFVIFSRRLLHKSFRKIMLRIKRRLGIRSFDSLSFSRAELIPCSSSHLFHLPLSLGLLNGYLYNFLRN